MRRGSRCWITESDPPLPKATVTSAPPRSCGSSRRATSFVPRTAVHCRRCTVGSLSAASQAITSKVRTLWVACSPVAATSRSR